MGLPAEAPAGDHLRTHLWLTFRSHGRTVGRIGVGSGPVRWGPRPGLEFTYPAAGLSGPERLARVDRRGARLWLPEGAEGYLAVGPTRLPLEALGAWGLLRGPPGRRWVRLTPQMEGEVRHRGLVIGLEFGPAPLRDVPPVRLAAVPRRFRRSVLAREERPFAAFTSAVYAVLLAVAVGLSLRPLAEEPRPEAVAQRFARLIYEAPQDRKSVV